MKGYWLRNVAAVAAVARQPAQVRGTRTQPIRARYDNAQSTDDNQRSWWMADYLSAKSANSFQVRRQLRLRSRYETSNNPYLFGICNSNADDLVGTGPTLQVATPDAGYNRRVEQAWKAWAAEVGLVEKLRTCKLARTVDGEGFLILKTVPDLEGPVKLYPCDVEADQVTTPAPLNLGELWVDGLVLHPATGRPTAYTVLRHHPGDYYFPDMNPLAVDRIAARHVVHWFPKFRPGQVRGVPVFTPALDMFNELRSYRKAVLAKCQVAANLTAVLQTKAPADISGIAADTVAANSATEPFDALNIDRGTMTTLPWDATLSQFAAPSDATTYEMFQEKCLGEACRPLNYPLGLALGTSQKFNFSSAKLDHINYREGLKVERSDCEATVLARLFAAWVAEAVLEGAIPPAPGAASRTAAPPHEWHWPGFSAIDPGADSQADIAQLNAGTLTYREFWAQRGYDWRTVLKQQGEEKKELEKLGLSFGTPPVAGAANQQQQGQDGGGGPGGGPPGGGGKKPAPAEATINLNVLAGGGKWAEDGHVRDETGRFSDGVGEGQGKGEGDKGQEVKSGWAKVKDVAKAAKETWTAAGKRAYAALPRPLRRAVDCGAWVEHKLESGYEAGRELAKATAKERGLSEEHVERVGRVLAVADGVSRWTGNVPVLHHVLEAAAGIGGPVGFVAAKLGYYVPVASLAYVGYSLARESLGGHPIRMITAARKRAAEAMRDRAASHQQHQHQPAGQGAKAAAAILAAAGVEGRKEAAAALLEWYAGMPSDAHRDWADALLAAATDAAGGGLGVALRLAQEAYAGEPDGFRASRVPDVRAAGDDSGGRWVTRDGGQHVWLGDGGDVHPGGPGTPPARRKGEPKGGGGGDKGGDADKPEVGREHAAKRQLERGQSPLPAGASPEDDERAVDRALKWAKKKGLKPDVLPGQAKKAAEKGLSKEQFLDKFKGAGKKDKAVLGDYYDAEVAPRIEKAKQQQQQGDKAATKPDQERRRPAGGEAGGRYSGPEGRKRLMDLFHKSAMSNSDEQKPGMIDTSMAQKVGSVLEQHARGEPVDVDDLFSNDLAGHMLDRHFYPDDETHQAANDAMSEIIDKVSPAEAQRLFDEGKISSVERQFASEDDWRLGRSTVVMVAPGLDQKTPAMAKFVREKLGAVSREEFEEEKRNAAEHPPRQQPQQHPQQEKAKRQAKEPKPPPPPKPHWDDDKLDLGDFGG